MWFRAGAWLAAVGVAMGAFGAHALKARLTLERLAVWETGARYQLLIAVALMAAGAAGASGRASALLLAGAIIFSGSLYLLCLTDVRAWGAVTPIGGLLMIAGFVWLGARP